MFLWTMRALTAVSVLATALHLVVGDEVASPTPAAPQTPAVGLEPSPEERADELAGPDPAEVEHDLQAHRDFTAFLDHLIGEVLAARVPAPEARDQLYYFCLTHYPKHLQHLHFFEAGDTAKAKVAHYLLRAIHSYEETHGLPESGPEKLDGLDDAGSSAPPPGAS